MGKLMGKNFIHCLHTIIVLISLVGILFLYWPIPGIVNFQVPVNEKIPIIFPGGLFVLLLGIWIIYSGGNYVWSRYALLWLAKICGYLLIEVRTQLWKIMLLILAIASFQWVFPKSLPKFLEVITLENVLKIFALIAFLYILYWALKLRRYIVPVPFENITGNKDLEILVKGIHLKLVNKLNCLVDLIQTIDTINPKSADKMICATVKTGNVGENLKDLVTSDQKIKLASFLEIPVGSLVAALGRILRGTRLEGSLQKKGNGLELIAQISGGRLRGNWCISSNDLNEKEMSFPDEGKIEIMAEQLAYRIFTTLSSDVGSLRWRAVYHYSEGFCAYRRTLGKENEKYFYLRKAEDAFIAALNEDNKFVQCHYNLGVVYTELGQGESAESAFREALKEDHQNANAYFSLGIYYFKKKKFGDALWYCEQAIRLKPKDSRFWNLRGVVYDEICLGKNNRLNADASSSNQPLISFKIAAKLSWQKLCSLLLRGETNLKTKDSFKNIARICMTNLARAYADKGSRKCKRFFHQAVSVSSGEGIPYYELGKFHCKQNEWKEALSAFENVFEEDVSWAGRIVFWSLYLYAFEKLTGSSKCNYNMIMADIKRHLLDAISERLMDIEGYAENLEKTINKILDTYDSGEKYKEVEILLNNTKRDDALFRDLWEGILRMLIDEFNEEEIELKTDKDQLEEKADKWTLYLFKWTKELLQWAVSKKIEFEKAEINWAKAQLSILLAKRFLDHIDRKYKKCPRETIKEGDPILYIIIGWLQEAEKSLNENQYYLREVKIHGLYMLLARCYILTKDYLRALLYAQEAVKLDPESVDGRTILSRVYFIMNNYDMAQKELEKCLILKKTETNKPEVQKILHYIPIMHKWQFLSSNREKTMGKLESICDCLEKTLIQIKPRSIKEADQEDYFEDLEIVYHKLGEFQRELKKYDEAIANLRIASSICDRGKARLAKIHLGWAYMEAGDYNRAEQVFRELGGVKDKKEDRRSIEIRLGLAASIIERTMWTEQVDELFGEPLHLLEKVNQLLNGKNQNNPDYLWYHSLYHECLGRIAFKKDKTNPAIQELEHSVSLMASPRVYYFLAEAYWMRSQEEKQTKQYFYLEKAREACAFSQKCDKNDKYTREVEELKKRITHAMDRIYAFLSPEKEKGK